MIPCTSDVASQICGTLSSVSFWSSEALLAARVTDTAETNGDALTPSVSATELVSAATGL